MCARCVAYSYIEFLSNFLIKVSASDMVRMVSGLGILSNRNKASSNTLQATRTKIVFDSWNCNRKTQGDVKDRGLAAVLWRPS